MSTTQIPEQMSANGPSHGTGIKEIGEVILDVNNISLSFGGVKALTDISFNVREHEIRAIIGPNGAGKSSMLNCINGVYTPQQGSITFRGKSFSHMDSHQVAVMGIGRTFQNLALFKGMSVIDNIMTGRNLKIKSNLDRVAALEVTDTVPQEAVIISVTPKPAESTATSLKWKLQLSPRQKTAINYTYEVITTESLNSVH